MAFAQCSDAGLIAVADAISSSVDSGSALATVDGSGLNDPVTDAHTGANIQQLVLNGTGTGPTDPNADPDPWVHYDLGATESVDSIRFWNYNATSLLSRSIRDLDVYGSTDGAAFGDDGHASWTLIGSFTDLVLAPRASGGALTDPYGTNYDLTDSDIRYVRFDLVRTFGSQPAFAEVQFFSVAAVPEPSSLLTVGCFFGLAVGRRRRRQAC